MHDMQLLIKFIAILIIIQTCIFLLRADLMREVIRFFSRGNRIYLAAAIRIVVAVLLFLGATQCHRMWVIIAIGSILLISGIAIFTLNAATSKKILTWFQHRTDLFLRLLAAIGLVVGGLLLYAA